jgi:hypothetical protein
MPKKYKAPKVQSAESTKRHFRRSPSGETVAKRRVAAHPIEKPADAARERLRVVLTLL